MTMFWSPKNISGSKNMSHVFHQDASTVSSSLICSSQWLWQGMTANRARNAFCPRDQDASLSVFLCLVEYYLAKVARSGFQTWIHLEPTYCREYSGKNQGFCNRKLHVCTGRYRKKRCQSHFCDPIPRLSRGVAPFKCVLQTRRYQVLQSAAVL